MGVDSYKTEMHNIILLLFIIIIMLTSYCQMSFLKKIVKLKIKTVFFCFYFEQI